MLTEITNNISKLVPEHDLDASFTIDGINFVRGSNIFTDAIDGLDFTLLDATGKEEQMTVSRDITSSKDNLEDFSKAFNEVNDTIRERTFINAEIDNKGPLQKYRTIRNLSTTLRHIILLTLGVSKID